MLFTKQCQSLGKIIFIDNQSIDDTIPYLKSEGYEVISNDKNSTPRAINIAFHYGNYDAVCILANDHFLSPGWLDGVVYDIEHHDLGCASPFTFISSSGALKLDPIFNEQFYIKYMQLRQQYIHSTKSSVDAYIALIKKTYVAGWRDNVIAFKNRHKEQQPIMPTSYWPGCSIYTKETIQRIGDYDERFILSGGYADLDYTLRMASHKVRRGISFKAFIHHFGSISTRKMGLDKDDIDSRAIVEAEKYNQKQYKEKWGAPHV